MRHILLKPLLAIAPKAVIVAHDQRADAPLRG